MLFFGGGGILSLQVSSFFCVCSLIVFFAQYGVSRASTAPAGYGAMTGVGGISQLGAPSPPPTRYAQSCIALLIHVWIRWLGFTTVCKGWGSRRVKHLFLGVVNAGGSGPLEILNHSDVFLTMKEQV